jgi:hypothetical protein
MARQEQNAVSLIEGYFPDVNWTGGSGIHRSLVLRVPVGLGGQRQHRRIQEALYHSNAAALVLEWYQGKFPDCEWILSPEEFAKLMFVDVYRNMKGLEPSTSKAKLRNPKTGNVFHRVAMRDGIIGGIRWWFSDYGAGENGVGSSEIQMRFRWEGLEGEEGNARTAARQKIEEAAVEFEELTDELMIGEPTADDIETARETVRVPVDEDD